jgi:hypothetical protein
MKTIQLNVIILVVLGCGVVPAAQAQVGKAIPVLQSDPKEWTNLAGNPEYSKQVERMRKHVPPEAHYKHFIRYGHFKAVITVDGSEMLIYNLARENHIEERDSEANEYPHVVAEIKEWLNENPGQGKRIVIPQ